MAIRDQAEESPTSGVLEGPRPTAGGLEDGPDGLEGAPAGRRPRGRARRAVGVVAANVVGVAVLLLVLEGAVRVARPDIQVAGSDQALFLDSAFVDGVGRTTGLRPGAVGQANGVAVRVDERGFHAYTGNGALRDGAGTWLWLGDSVTFGVGVVQDSTVAGRIAAGQDTAAVLNPSVLGWGTADYRRRLEGALEDGLRPDRVTLVWCLNDADPARPSAAGEVGGLESLTRKARARLNVHSRLYRWAKDAALDRPARYYEHDRRLYQDARLDSAWTDLEAVAAALEDAGVPLEVVVVPYEPQLRPGGDRGPQEVLIPRLRALGVPVLDLFGPFLEAGDPEGLYLWSDGIHLSSRGHAVAAAEIARWRPRD